MTAYIVFTVTEIRPVAGQHSSAELAKTKYAPANADINTNANANAKSQR